MTAKIASQTHSRPTLKSTMRSTMSTLASAALCRTMPLFHRAYYSIVGQRLTHNAGVGSSSLPPATFSPDAQVRKPSTVYALARLCIRRALDWSLNHQSTTRSTKPLRTIANPPSIYDLPLHQLTPIWRWL